MPQTAFSATGAGVKSSVLFLKKHSEEHTADLKQRKLNIQNNLKNQYAYENQLKAWDKEKALIIKKMEGFDNPYDDDMTLTELKKTEEYKAWKAEIDAEYREKINELKEKLEDLYLQNKQNGLPDYPVFMAIAEDIGYDATGKQTQVNELELISTELAKFIQEIENGSI